ncbi:small heat shock protein, chloroplastic-like [Cornus florida]|uniref:small heat shock protein, chloroplastic-like n=1 Tax=Cornus florida TaxID=4283 RepID=UPI0028963C42|nr:small heat shock protein, chloroplastic-like [Cornus florida]
MASRYIPVAKLFRSNRPFTVAASTFAGHHHSFSSSGAPDNHTRSQPSRERVMVKVPLQEVKMENPFQCGGPGNAVEVNEVKEGVLVRMALPGVGENGIKVWAENHTVFFQGDGEKEYEKDDCGRRYVGSLEFSPDEQRADGVKFEMKNGILRLMVPNVEGKEEKNTKGKKEKKMK